MKTKQEKGQFYTVLLLAVIVIGISAWALVQGICSNEQGTNLVAAEDTETTDHSQGTSEQKQKVDTSTFAEKVLKSVSFDTDLALLDDTVTESMIAVNSEDTKVMLYMGEGTCADELLILEASDNKNAKLEVDRVQQHLSDMQQSFSDYLPKEAKKIDHAIILQKDNYIVACVTSDYENAKKVISEQFQ